MPAASVLMAKSDFMPEAMQYSWAKQRRGALLQSQVLESGPATHTVFEKLLFKHYFNV